MELTDQTSSHSASAAGLLAAFAAAMCDAEAVAAVFLLAFTHLALADATVHVAPTLALLAALAARELAALTATVRSAVAAAL